MLLFELYDEPKVSTFTHDGRVYDLNKLLELSKDMDSDDIPLDQLIWVLDWDEPDPKRVKKADLTAPILVTWWHDDNQPSQLVVLDGLHRLARAEQLHHETIVGKYIRHDMLEDCLYKSRVNSSRSST